MPLYVADTNVFIQAHRSTYPLDVATSFWNLIKQLAEDEKINSIDKVRDEIEENEDELQRWIQTNLSDEFFKDTNQDSILTEYGLMAPWAESRANHYQRGAVDEFLDFYNADAWLVAYCKSTGHTLVIQEVSNPNQINRIPIPEACIAFDVNYCNMIDMFRELKVRF